MNNLTTLSQPLIPATYVTLRLGSTIIASPTFQDMQQAVLEYARMVRPQDALPPQQQLPKRQLTPEGRRRIAAATKARHAEAKAKRLAGQEEPTPIVKKSPAKVQGKPKVMQATA